MPLLGFLVLSQNRASPPGPYLFFLCHRRQDLLVVAARTEGVASVAGDADLPGWSEDWYVTEERPPRYVPPTPAVWHGRVDLAPASVSPYQAGYRPAIRPLGIGDRRAVGELRTRVTVEWWPIYVDNAPDKTRALAQAKAQWVDPIYSAGRPMTEEEWIAYTGFQNVKPDWFDPIPMRWDGLKKVGGVQTVTWRLQPIPTKAPYNAAIGPSDVGRENSASDLGTAKARSSS